MSKPQQTIKKAVSYQGIGLHSGEPVHMVFKPAPEDTGIVFVRTDIEGHPSVRAHIDNVTNTMRATTLENGEAKVFTVEHVMAAFSAMNIDNCYIEMDSPEPPVGDRFIVILPYDGYRMTFTSINSHPLLGTQQCDFEVSPEYFKAHIGSARTIGFMKELEQLQAMGLAKGGSLDNALVYDDEKCLSIPRFEDELVRHKALDVIGDLFLLGPIEGHVIALKSSHELNSRLARSIMEEIRETQP